MDLLHNQYDETDARYSNILLNCFSLIFSRAYIKARQGNVGLSVILWYALNFCTDVHGPQRMNPNDWQSPDVLSPITRLKFECASPVPYTLAFGTCVVWEGVADCFWQIKESVTSERW